MFSRVIVLVLLLVAVCSSELFAKGPKTVHVRGYTRKDGTYVRPHYRSAPSRGSSLGSAANVMSEPSARTTARTTARSEARVSARTHYNPGMARLYDAEDHLSSSSPEESGEKKPAPTVVPEKPRQSRPVLPVAFRVHLTNGSVIDASAVSEKDGRYFVVLPRGGTSGYPKAHVKSVEPVSDATQHDTVTNVDDDGTIRTKMNRQLILSGIALKNQGGVQRLRTLLLNEPIVVSDDGAIGNTGDKSRQRVFVIRDRDQLDIALEMIRSRSATVDMSHPCIRTREFIQAAEAVQH